MWFRSDFSENVTLAEKLAAVLFGKSNIELAFGALPRQVRNQSDSWKPYVAWSPVLTDRQTLDAVEWGEEWFAKGFSDRAAHDSSYRRSCFEEALFHFSRAAERGNVVAHRYLGIILGYGLTGQIRSGDLVLAYQHLRVAAFHGDLEACWVMGQLITESSYWDKSDAPQWFLRVFGLLSKHASDGLLSWDSTSFFDAVADLDGFALTAVGMACLGLGTCYQEAYGVPADQPQALGWYLKAHFLLGLVVEEGGWFYKRYRKIAHGNACFLYQEYMEQLCADDVGKSWRLPGISVPLIYFSHDNESRQFHQPKPA